MNFRRRLPLRAAMFACAAVMPMSAYAQTVPNAPAGDQDAPEPSPPQDEAQSSGDIVVTATRRSTTLQRTPVSITAITGDTLRQQSATNVQDYFRQIPNANVTQGPLGAARISFRGIRSAGEATVGLFYDETPITGPAGTTQDPGNNAADLNLFDVQRVEALRGPQGTLFGSSSVGGTLRILFNQPNTREIQTATELQASTVKGGGEGWFVKGMVNLPLVKDKMALRVSGYTERRPGYIDNIRYGTTDDNHSKNSGVRGLLAFTPADNFSVTFSAIYQKSSSPDAQGWYEALGRNKTNSTVRQVFDNKFQLYSVTTRWGTPIGDLTVNNAHYAYDVTRSFESTAAVLTLSQNPALCPLFIGAARACTAAELAGYAAYGRSRAPAGGYQLLNLTAFTNEARLSSRGNGPIQYTIGLFHENREDDVDSRVVTTDPIGTLLADNVTAERTVGTDTRQFSQFGELSVKPFSLLTLTAGLRHYEYSKSTRGAVIRANPVVGLLPQPASSVTADASGWIKKFNASLQLTPDVLAYATYSEGFRPGGANNVQGLSSAFTVYDADKLKNYEGGLKLTLLDGRLGISGSLFRADWNNLQTGAVTANGLYSFLINAGAARIQGGELEIVARPVRNVNLSLGYGHSDAKLTADQTATGVTANGSTGRAGDRLPGVPRDTVSGSAAFSLPISDTLSGLFRLDGAYTGPQNSEFRGPNLEHIPGYASLNARLGLRRGSIEVALFVQNLADARGLTYAYSTLGIRRQAFSINPRTFGINFAGSF